MKKIYIAGFDVFCGNAKEIGEKYKEICRKYGFESLYPLDNQCESSIDIFKGNISLIEQADIICANLNNFRGNEPDSGTAFEVGFGFAKGKKLYGYRNNLKSLRDCLGEKDSDGYSVEDFGMCVNLMIGCCCKIIEGDFETCVKSVKRDLTD